MAWPSIGSSRSLAGSIIVLAAAILAVTWALKIRDVQRLKFQVALTESRLKRAQDLWRDYRPLDPEKRQGLEMTQERLFLSLPGGEELPGLYEDISRLAREFNLSEVTIDPPGQASKAGSGKGPSPANPPRVAPAQPASSPGRSQDVGPIQSFTVEVNFLGDYREIAYFLEALGEIPRLVTVQSVELRRRVPLVAVKLILRSYYQEGELPGGPR